jgi:hypothetical protein
MMSYDFAGNEWKRFEFWDSKKKYTRNLIANVPGCLCLMLLCWNPEKGSPIHNHAGSEWSVRHTITRSRMAGRATTPIARMSAACAIALTVFSSSHLRFLALLFLTSAASCASLAAASSSSSSL